MARRSWTIIPNDWIQLERIINQLGYNILDVPNSLADIFVTASDLTIKINSDEVVLSDRIFSVDSMSKSDDAVCASHWRLALNSDEILLSDATVIASNAAIVGISDAAVVQSHLTYRANSIENLASDAVAKCVSDEAILSDQSYKYYSDLILKCDSDEKVLSDAIAAGASLSEVNAVSDRLVSVSNELDTLSDSVLSIETYLSDNTATVKSDLILKIESDEAILSDRIFSIDAMSKSDDAVCASHWRAALNSDETILSDNVVNILSELNAVSDRAVANSDKIFSDLDQPVKSDSVPTFSSLNLTANTNLITVDGTTFLANDPVGALNLFVGEDCALTSRGAANLCIGYQAGYHNRDNAPSADGSENTYIGYQSGYGNAGDNSGYDNVGIGYETLWTNTTGFGNMAIGAYALWANTTGNRNVGLGYYALRTNTQGSDNIGIGRYAIFTNLIGNCNLGIGSNSLLNATGNNTTAIGYQSGNLLSSGASNVFIGYSAGCRQTTLSNIFIIDNQDRTTAANEITKCLLYGIFDATNTSQTLRINARVGIFGTPVARLDLPAGSITAGTAPLKFTSGALLGAPVAGTMEFLTDSLYFTITTGAARRTIAFTSDCAVVQSDMIVKVESDEKVLSDRCYSIDSMSKSDNAVCASHWRTALNSDEIVLSDQSYKYYSDLVLKCNSDEVVLSDNIVLVSNAVGAGGGATQSEMDAVSDRLVSVSDSISSIETYLSNDTATAKSDLILKIESDEVVLSDRIFSIDTMSKSDDAVCASHWRAALNSDETYLSDAIVTVSNAGGGGGATQSEMDAVSDRLVSVSNELDTVSDSVLSVETYLSDNTTTLSNALIIPTFGSIVMTDGGTIGQAAGPLLTFDDTLNYLEISGCKVGIGTTTPADTLEVNYAMILKGGNLMGGTAGSGIKASSYGNNWGLDYLYYDALTANTGIAVNFAPSGTPADYNYAFNFNTAVGTQLLMVGSDTLNKHIIAVGNFTSNPVWNLVFRCAATGTSWNDAPDAMTIQAGTPVDTLNLYSTGKVGMFGGLQVNSSFNFAADAQANDTYVITLSPAATAYTTGMMIVFTANTVNTGACTVNVNGLGAKALKVSFNADPANGWIKAGSVVIAVYDGTNFQMLQPDATP